MAWRQWRLVKTARHRFGGRPFARAVQVPSVAPFPTARWASSPDAIANAAARDHLSLEAMGALVDSMKVQAPEEAYNWMVTTLAVLQEQSRDRDALLKRSWSDAAFEDGEDGNEQTLAKYEVELVGMLRSARKGLGDAVVLGSAIDLAGAYKKNYKLDKSEAVLLRCALHSEDRGGAWMVKYLNHLSQVRMKQRRNVEAMEMMYEMESLATFTMAEPGGSEFYETLYRNMSCCLRSMGREDDAAVYYLKMVEAAKFHKPTLDWMDLWELGVLIANRAFHSNRMSDFYKSREIIKQALQMQRVDEPDDEIMRAKVLSNLGQCYLATGEYDEADVYYTEAYELFDRTVGERSPLFGMQAWACGNLRCAQGRHREALIFLGQALYVEVVGDGISVSEILKLLDQLLGSMNECQRQGVSVELDSEAIERSLTTLVNDPRWDVLEDTVDLGVMAHKAALVYISIRPGVGCALDTAKILNDRAVYVLSRVSDEQKALPWLGQAEAIHRAALSSPRSS